MPMDRAELEDMRCTQAIQDFLDAQEWTDEIEVNEDRTSGRLATSMTLNDQSCRLYVEAEETEERVYVFLYFPIKTPPARLPEVARLLNRINAPMKLGRLALFDDEDANYIQYKAAIDVEDGTIVGTQIASMIIPGRHTFLRYWDLLMSACLTKQSEDALWEKFIEEEKVKETQEQENAASDIGEDAGPAEL